MKNQIAFLFTISILFFGENTLAQFTYISPMPESNMHRKETGIILRTGESVDASTLSTERFTITGSISGSHLFRVKLAADNKSILLNPLTIFVAGETVFVSIKDGIRNINGSVVKQFNFEFTISTYDNATQQLDSDDSNNGELRTLCNHLQPFEITSVQGAYYDHPLFYWNWAAPTVVSDCWTRSIISSDGDSIFGEYNNDVGFDFKINDNGYLTCFNKTDSCFNMLDSNYNVVKKFYMGNGYSPNKHEFRVYPNGYHFMQCYDAQEVDMTAYGGQPNAIVTGLVIQQIDSNDDVIFQWRSWDHFQFTDAANDISLITNNIDYVHCNSMELDADGNLIFSSRNLDEITKIDLLNGEIIWRMGGKKNQFTFINNPDSPKPFSHQHHFRRLPNGHYTMFDNGNFQSIARSTAKEFVLDEENKTATLVWNYSHPLVNGYNVYSTSLGSVQVLPNGNRFIDWGQIAPNILYADIPNFTEVDTNGNIVWEFRFIDSNYVSYRAFKFPWDRCNLIIDSSLIAEDITATEAELIWNNNSKFSGFNLQYRKCGTNNWDIVSLDTNYFHLTGLSYNTCYEWQVQSFCELYKDSFLTAIHKFKTQNPTGLITVQKTNANVIVYPNPAQDEIHVQLPENFSGLIEVRNIIGNLVWLQHTEHSDFKLESKQLPLGVYQLIAKSESDTCATKFIIER